MWKCVILLFLSVTNFATKTCSNQGAYNFTIFLAPTKILIVSGQCNTVTKDFTIFSNLQSAAPGHWLSAYSTFPPGPAKFNLGLGHCSLLLNRVPLRRCFPKELAERCLNGLSFKHRVASCWQPSRCLRYHGCVGNRRGACATMVFGTVPRTAQDHAASSGWPCCPFWDWALPCSHFILDRACVVW
jgi:hypothetical protein